MTATAPVAPPSETHVSPGSLKAWILAARPKTLTAALSPVFVGTALAMRRDHFELGAGTLALLGAICLQIASNFANDVFDYEKGADTAERLGPRRAVQSGWLSPRQMRIGLAVVVGLGLLVGSALAWLKGGVIIALGLGSLVAALGYTGGPYPLGYNGLGDLFVLLFFGLVAVLGTEFVHGAPITLISVLYAVALGGLATNLLVVNNVRDQSTDVRAGKRTLAVRFGRRFAEFEFLGFTAVAYGVPILSVALGFLRAPALLPLLSLPLAIRNVLSLRRLEGRELNSLLGRVAGLLFVYAVLASVGLLLSPEGEPPGG
jgi:1,4-dihydroxy-2-naphthoate polyprenyltransferase